MESQEKRCTKCQQVLSLDKFGKDKHASDGLTSACKSCRKRQFSNWYANNAESDREKGREYRLNNLEKERERYQRYEDEKRDAERRVENQRKRYQKNPEKHRIAMREWYRNNPEKASLMGAQGKSRGRAIKYGLTEHFSVAEWKELCEKYGNRCLRCNRAGRLSPDHILPLTCGGDNTIANIQPLCKKCNSTKKDMHIDYRPECEYRGYELSVRLQE